MQKIVEKITQELGVKTVQIQAAVALMDEGATVPFIARYRKEITGGLDDIQLRSLEERLHYLRELEDRRSTILKSIEDQGKMDDSLKHKLEAADTKTALEDLYLPYRPKRRTKAQIAKEAGLEPLANRLLNDSALNPEEEASLFLNAEHAINDNKTALDGARQILMERFSENAALIGQLREYVWDNAIVRSQVVKGKESEAKKFSDYFEYEEAVNKIPSHRALALFRGRNEGMLNLELVVDEEAKGVSPSEITIARHFEVENLDRPADAWLAGCVRWAWKVKIFTHLDLELKTRLRGFAEEEAIKVFGTNLKDLLLAAPAGSKSIIGLDPGLRTGVKVAVVDTTGKVVDIDTIYPHVPKNRWDESIHKLQQLSEKHGCALVAIGNGTASRETDRLAQDLIQQHPKLGLTKVLVSEAGASIYSASELASKELPDLDVSIRGAVSIARRLQDPLAELVKIDPKSIGVGQYQHDVNQAQLTRSLNNTVEDCVNSVGVDINTASPALLQQVAGLNKTLAENIVDYRDTNGRFGNRKELLKVARLGDKTYEQAAGFLRISGGDNPLDSSAVHPEAYPVVAKILTNTGRSIKDLMGDNAFIRKLNAKDYTSDRFGLPTITDILTELDKPGRDPRGEFKTASFKEGVETLTDLLPDMILEGVVTNVTNFGAFVDIGVHQDGLVHISALADKFVKDPREVVKAGQLVKVKVLEVDQQRKRIGLTMRLSDSAKKASSEEPKREVKERKKRPQKITKTQANGAQGAMAAALGAAMKRS